MRGKKTQKCVTIETTFDKWLAVKTLAYSTGKTVKTFINELIDRALKEAKSEAK